MSTGNEIQFADDLTGFWAEIILPLALPTTYTYSIPSQFLHRALPGCRVEVIFGKQKKYAGIIVPIDPLWKPLTEVWNTILPTKEDDELFSNIAEHCEMVVNLGSSTVFDFIAHEKPCGYFRYNQGVQINPKWNIFACYKFIHFRSMPDQAAVFWLDSAEEIAGNIETMLTKKSNIVLDNAKKWFGIINEHPPQEASARILKAIHKIIN